jgi:twitching motility protein PilI
MSEDRTAELSSAADKRWLSPSQALTTDYIAEDITLEEKQKTERIDRYSLSMGGLIFFIPSTTFCQVKNVSIINGLLNAPQYVLGLSNIGGNIVPIFDLAIFFGLSTTSRQNVSYAIIVGEPENSVGFVLDELPGRVIFYADQQEPVPPVPDSLKPFVIGSYRDRSTSKDLTHSEDKLCLELDLKSLLVEFRKSHVHSGLEGF